MWRSYCRIAHPEKVIAMFNSGLKRSRWLLQLHVHVEGYILPRSSREGPKELKRASIYKN